ncbi:type VI secretion system baseplate subunit TssE [Nevskia sp.]|uniref:type VI secretion system baseplate subunit TssE n=1 Tax=Nevskia sp. TaxID=1929292 RepID=UPI0025E07C14|nr:type VI secretion system baseplate subunit TssE [Nevskia sp.]
MAELTTQERLQPSLLDRLTDDEPEVRDESRERRVISATRLRDCVTRDLAWLLNAVQIEATVGLDDFPEVRRSVINYGIPDLTGVALSRINVDRLSQSVREAILRFEPRLNAASLRVIVESNSNRMDRAALVFRIESEMWAQPIPLNLYLKTEVDLETGRLNVTEALG